jgi:fluoride ion exporter CrcB/FEX
VTLLLLFGAGVAQDFLITAWTRAVSARRKMLASGMAGLVTVVSMLLLANVLLMDDGRVARVLALAAGNVLGTFLVIHAEEWIADRLAPAENR